MNGHLKAKDPFRFYTRLHLSELTGLRVTTLNQLSEFVKKVPGACIYHHTHRFLQQHQHLSPEPPNDFAHWVTDVLGEDELGEMLASIDTMRYSTIRGLRERISAVIDDYREKNPLSKMKFARAGEEFHFIKSVSFILPTQYAADDLHSFAEILRRITVDSIYFHVFESRLRLEKGTNDFSYWIEFSLGKKDLADELAAFDPYTRTLEGLRGKIIQTVERHKGA